MRTYKSIRKIATGLGDDYTTGCLSDYSYFKEIWKLITIDFSKQQAVNADPKEIQQINLAENLDQAGNKTMVFILEEVKETIFDFSQGTARVLWICFWLKTISIKIAHYKSGNPKLSDK